MPSLAGNWTDSLGHYYSLTQEGSNITGTRNALGWACSVSGTVSGNIISGSASLDIACNIFDPIAIIVVPDGVERKLNLNLVSNDQWEGSSDVGFGPSAITLNRN